MISQLTERLTKAVANPKQSLRLMPKVVAQGLTRLFPQAAFYWQGQMDIHRKSRWYNRSFVERFGGFFPAVSESDTREIVDLEPWDCVRRDMLVLLLRRIEQERIPGDFAELGVYQGSTARLIHRYAPDRTLHLFDTFEGFDTDDISAEQMSIGLHASQDRFADTSLAAVLNRVGGRVEAIKPHPGRFPESVPEVLNTALFAFVHLDADLYAPTLAGLSFFYHRVSPGGIIVVHDYNAWPGARQAVDTFFADKSEIPVPMPDKSGSAVIVKMR